MKIISAFLGLLFSFNLMAGDALHSSRRAPGESYRAAEARYFQRLTHDGQAVSREGSAVDVKKAFADIDWNTVPETGYVNELFYDLRDERFLEMKDKPDFNRRLSWLYPQDGCWIRAALMKQLSIKWDQGTPKKLFIFGNLKVSTENAPGGSVSWWYHVVPVFRDTEGDLMVLDPAIQSDRPLPVKEWILTQVDKLDSAQLSLCSGDAYSPSSQCIDPKSGEDENAAQQISTYLDAEWRNLVELKRDPEKELGNSPPWKP